jgi:Tol biopolymer transport system component/predicted Ser/Thr protein kinase
MVLASGARLGPYEIQSAIGAGGMGEVYKACDTRLDRTVAIKVLLTALASDPQFRERFDREARIISQLDHPHICALYDVGEQDGTSFLVMQYLEGETLEARLKRGALPLDRALEYAIQIADALNKAHRAGIAHRDLKPGNIMLTKTGATLLDFGLAKVGGPVGVAQGLSMLPTTPPGLTVQGTILGTFQYMAPEQLEGHEADARTDIFAFGAIVYEMITGKKAFEGKSQASLIAAILEREPPPVSSQQPLVPRTLDWVIRRCLAKDPDERWQTASDLSIALQWIAKAAATPASRQTSAGTSVRWWRMVSVALLVLAAAGWGMTVRRWRPASATSEPVVFSVAPPEGAIFATPGGLPGGLPWIALSPDGRVLAFVALSADGRQQVWLRKLSEAMAHPLAGTDGAQAPFWSPDSRSLAFFARGKLLIVDAAGGKTQIVADAPGLYGSGSWNRDNAIVFAPTPGGNGGLRTVRVGATDAGQFVTRTDRSQGPRGHFSPQFLADGRHFLFGVGGRTDAETWIGSLDGGEPRLLLRAEAVAHYAEPGYLLFKRGPLFAQRVDGPDLRFVGDPVRLTDAAVGSNQVVPYLALSTSMTGTLVYGAPSARETDLVWKDRNGRTLGSIDVTGASAPSLSRDGAMMVVSRTLPQTGTDLWLYDVKRTTPMRFTFDSAPKRSPIWSPDGKYVAFTATGDGPDLLYRKLTTGSGAEEVLLKTSGAWLSDWSADGRFILFHSSSPAEGQRTGMDLWFVTLANRQAKPFLQTRFHEIQGALSPDGRWVAYASDESGAFEVYVQAFPDGGSKRVVSNGGGAEPRWRADGRELFYVSADRRLMVVPTTIGPAFEAGKPTPLFEMNVRDLVFPFLKRYELTSDGQRFVVQELTRRGGPPPLTVVMNWPALLPKPQ